MRYNKSEKGFTLIEGIAVLLIIAILAAVAISRGASTAEAELRSSAEALRGHIRFAQMKAMNSDADKTSISACEASHGISFSGISYFLFKDCNVANKVSLPGAAGDTVSLPSMSLSATNAPNNLITFDKWGRPCTDVNGTTLPTSNITLRLSHTQVSQPVISTITKNTGYVP